VSEQLFLDAYAFFEDLLDLLDEEVDDFEDLLLTFSPYWRRVIMWYSYLKAFVSVTQTLVLEPDLLDED